MKAVLMGFIRTHLRISRRDAWAAVLFLLLTLIFTWPLPLFLRSQVIGPFLGDNLEYIWKLWWVEHAVINLKQSPLVHPDIYYPYGYPLAFGEITPLHTYFGLPLTSLFGPLVTYNLFILGSVFMTGYFTFLYVRELTGRGAAGLFAGLIFAVIPYRMARIAGHLPLVDTQWIPLYLLFLERTLRRLRPKDAALAGLFFAASTLSSWYYGFALGLLSPIYILTRRRAGDSKFKWPAVIEPVVFFIGTVLIAVLPFLLPYLQIARQGDNQIPLVESIFWSASVTDLLTPNPLNFWWGDSVQSSLSPYGENMPYEFILNWGFVASLLAISGWRSGRREVRRGWLWWIGVATLLSFGPVFKLFGVVITFPVPEIFGSGLMDLLNGLGGHSFAGEVFPFDTANRASIPLPALLLRWFIPGLDGLRSWGRFAMFGALGVAVLAGEGLVTGIDRALGKPLDPAIHTNTPKFPPRLIPAIWVLFFGGLTLLEFYPGPQQLISPGPRGVDLWLASHDEKRTIIQLPVEVALSGPQMYYSMFNGQRLASGYGTYFPILFAERYPALQDFPSDDAIDLLAGWGGGSGREIGVDFILVDEKDVPADDPLRKEIEDQPRLHHVITVDQIRVYTLK